MTLDLPKPEKKPEPEVNHRERREHTTDEARLLKSVGERISPDGVKYVGSFASHIYKNDLSGEFLFFSQTTDLREVPELIGNKAIKELARALVIKYQGKVPKKVGERNDI